MTLTQKRTQFSKDLDKMMSGDYVLVPLQPTEEMLTTATITFYNTPHGTDASTLIAKLWSSMLNQHIAQTIIERCHNEM